MSENPPPYSDIQPGVSSQSLPPQYTLPETFIIGSQRVNLLVHPQHLKGHLSLLHAFHTLRHTIEAGDVSRLPHDVRTMDPEKRWGWFVNIAVERYVSRFSKLVCNLLSMFYRFSRWCISLNERRLRNIEQTLPPIDVVMVWHAYLLNPMYEYTIDSALQHSLTSWIVGMLKTPHVYRRSSPWHHIHSIWPHISYGHPLII